MSVAVSASARLMWMCAAGSGIVRLAVPNTCPSSCPRSVVSCDRDPGSDDGADLAAVHVRGCFTRTEARVQPGLAGEGNGPCIYQAFPRRVGFARRQANSSAARPSGMSRPPLTSAYATTAPGPRWPGGSDTAGDGHTAGGGHTTGGDDVPHPRSPGPLA